MGKPQLFDADQRSKDRTEAGLKLDGVVYPRRRRTNAVLAEIRRISREGDELQAELDKLRAAKTPNQEKIDEVGVKSDATTFEMIATYLGEGPDGEEITAEALSEKLDLADAIALLNYLGDVDENGDEPDPS